MKTSELRIVFYFEARIPAKDKCIVKMHFEVSYQNGWAFADVQISYGIW